MDGIILIRLFALCICTGISAITDIIKGKIYNCISVSGIIVGVVTCSSFKELHATIIALLLIFLFGMLRLMGMGDIKLWMAIASLVGLQTSCIFVALGGLLLIIYTLCSDFRNSLEILEISIKSLLYNRKLIPFEQKGYPFAPFLFIPSLTYSFICIVSILV